MDLWCVQVKSNVLVVRNSIPEKSAQWMKNSSLFPSRSFWVHDFNLFGINSSASSKPYSNLPLFARAMGPQNNPDNFDSSSSSSGDNDQPNPEGDDFIGSNPSPEKYESHDAPSQKSHVKPLDWREFRALLYTNEQAESHKQEKSFGSKLLPAKWAHPLSTPENGCLLVATEKLDGIPTFKRTVILLLRSGTKNPQEGPFGIIINRPLHKKIKHMKPNNLYLATTFADCSLHFGGPLEASMFLLKAAETSDLAGFEEVIPGVCFGSRNNLDAAGGLIKKGMLKPQDFRFFYGYAGWQLDQLQAEIDSEYWHVAACSANILLSGSQNSSEGMWEEVLQLMGGHRVEP